MAVSRKVQELLRQGSWIRKMFEEGIALRRRYGDDNVFDLSLGNPVVEPPVEFYQEIRRVIESGAPGLHRYMPNAGYADTRAAVAKRLGAETGEAFDAEHIVMTCGAGGALNVIMKTLLDPGDEVVILAPYFVEYRFYADNHGGVCRTVPPADGFYPDLAALEASINRRTRIVLVNSPNNPTGVVYDADLMRAVGNIIARRERELGREIFLVSDEPYRKLLYDGIEYPHVYQFHPRSVVATSHSKDLALPGERIGFIAVSPRCPDGAALMEGLILANRILGFVNAPALMQHVVKRLQSVTVDVAQYQAKRDFLYNGLVEMGYSVVKPQGAFYMFPRAPVDDDVAFVADLLERRVLAVPGAGFGVGGHFRLSYCVSDRALEGALLGLRAALDRYRAA